MKLLDILTPINIAEEREKFFASQTYNPIFKYTWQTIKPHIKGTSTKADLKRAIVNQSVIEILANAQYYFGIKSFDYTRIANDYVNSNKDNLKGHFFNNSSSSVKEMFNDTFKSFALDYKIKFTDSSGFNFRPNYKNKILYVSKTACLGFFDIEGEVKHELTHIIRHENSKHNKIMKSIDYIQTEEGLATYFQDNANYGAISKYQHAAEYIASMVGLSGSLRDIYDYFKYLNFDDELAWQRAIRHKFGFIDTAKQGDILKPAMYYHNSMLVEKLKDHQRLILFNGKISIKDLDKHEKYSGIIDRYKIVDFYNLYV